MALVKDTMKEGAVKKGFEKKTTGKSDKPKKQSKGNARRKVISAKRGK